LKDLHLSSPSQGLGDYVQTLMQKADHPQRYVVLEDRSTVSGDVRVFVGYKSPQPGLISLERITDGASLKARSRASS